MKLRRFLQVDLDKCTGCRTCEMVCSLTHSSECNPLKSSIRVTRMKLKGVMIPVYCKQCEDPPCRNVCPANAITVEPKTGAIMVLDERCIGCRECILVCPFGAIFFDADKRVPIICDLCDGDPQCVKYCIDEAMIYPRLYEAGRSQRDKYTKTIARVYLSKSEVM